MEAAVRKVTEGLGGPPAVDLAVEGTDGTNCNVLVVAEAG